MNRPLSNQNVGKKTFFPTIGSTILLRPPTTDSTTSCPLLGIKDVLPASIRTNKIIKAEITQLVIMEFVTGKSPNKKAWSAVKLTPSPAALAKCVHKKKNNT